MNSLRPGVAWFCCITFNLGVAEIHRQQWAGVDCSRPTMPKQNSGNAGTNTQQGKLNFRLGQPKIATSVKSMLWKYLAKADSFQCDDLAQRPMNNNIFCLPREWINRGFHGCWDTPPTLEWRVITHISEGGDFLVVSSRVPALHACVPPPIFWVLVAKQPGKMPENGGTSFPYISTGQMGWFSDILKPNPELFKICNLNYLSISLLLMWLNTLFKLYQ